MQVVCDRDTTTRWGMRSVLQCCRTRPINDGFQSATQVCKLWTCRGSRSGAARTSAGTGTTLALTRCGHRGARSTGWRRTWPGGARPTPRARRSCTFPRALGNGRHPQGSSRQGQSTCRHQHNATTVNLVHGAGTHFVCYPRRREPSARPSCRTTASQPPMQPRSRRRPRLSQPPQCKRQSRAPRVTWPGTRRSRAATGRTATTTAAPPASGPAAAALPGRCRRSAGRATVTLSVSRLCTCHEWTVRPGASGT